MAPEGGLRRPQAVVQARAIGYCRLTRAPTPFLGGDAETHAISCAGDDQEETPFAPRRRLSNTI